MSTWALVLVLGLWVVVVVQLVFNVVLFRQLGIMVLGTARGANDSGIPVGRRLPAFEVETLDGRRWTPDDWRGHDFTIFFGAPYCAECRDIVPDLHRLAAGGRRVLTLLFATEAQSRKYAAEVDLPGPVAPLPQELAHALDVEVTPFALGVDPNGTVRDKGLVNSSGALARIAGYTAAPATNGRAAATEGRSDRQEVLR